MFSAPIGFDGRQDFNPLASDRNGGALVHCLEADRTKGLCERRSGFDGKPPVVCIMIGRTRGADDGGASCYPAESPLTNQTSDAE